MGSSRLERTLRAAAWMALVVTVAALVSAGLLVQVSAADGGMERNQAAASAAAAEEGR